MAEKELDVFEQLRDDMARRYAEWDAQTPEEKEREAAARRARKEAQYLQYLQHLQQKKATESNADATLLGEGEGEETAGANEQQVVQSEEPERMIIDPVPGDINRADLSPTDQSTTASTEADSQKTTESDNTGTGRAVGLERQARMQYLSQLSDLTDAETEEYMRYLEEENAADYHAWKAQKQQKQKEQAATHAKGVEEQIVRDLEELTVDDGAVKECNEEPKHKQMHKRKHASIDDAAEGEEEKGALRICTDGQQRVKRKMKERRMCGVAIRDPGFKTGGIRRTKEAQKTGVVADMMATMTIDDAGASRVGGASQSQQQQQRDSGVYFCHPPASLCSREDDDEN